MASSPEPGPGRARLGPYQILSRLAVGGMAEVLEARRDGDEQTVVLKVLLPQHAADPEFAAMLADEARLALDLVHPNLVRVLEVGQGYLAMERVDGPPLSAILRHARCRGEGLPPALALLVGERLLEALSYIHGRQDQDGRPLEIVHRDISPGNVLVSRRGEVKLGDFGIARHRLRSARTRTGVIKGTVQYMAPEQLAGGDEVDRRTDLYGVGLLLFEMLAGRPLLDAEREVDLLRQAEAPPWVPPSSVRPGLDPRLDRLLRPALARYPEERYPSAEVFATALRPLRAELASSSTEEVLQAELGALACAAMEASPAEPPRLVGPPYGTRLASRRPPQRRALRAGILVGAAALAGLTGWGAWRGLHRGGTGSAVADAGARLPPPIQGRDGSAGERMVPPKPADAEPAPRPDARRRAWRPTRTPRKAAPARADARPAVVADELGPLRDRLQRALAAARGRGIMEEDLSAESRRRLQEVRRKLDEGDAARARPLLDDLERRLAGATVDRALVEAKLRRVDALLRGRPGAASLRERASTALQEFMDGRYAAANRNLNEILRLLAAASR